MIETYLTDDYSQDSSKLTTPGESRESRIESGSRDGLIGFQHVMYRTVTYSASVEVGYQRLPLPILTRSWSSIVSVSCLFI